MRSAIIDGAWLLCLHMCLYVVWAGMWVTKLERAMWRRKRRWGRDEYLKTGRSLLGWSGQGIGEKKEEEAKPNLFESAKMKSSVLYANFSKEGKIYYLSIILHRNKSCGKVVRNIQGLVSCLLQDWHRKVNFVSKGQQQLETWLLKDFIWVLGLEAEDSNPSYLGGWGIKTHIQGLYGKLVRGIFSKMTKRQEGGGVWI